MCAAVALTWKNMCACGLYASQHQDIEVHCIILKSKLLSKAIITKLKLQIGSTINRCSNTPTLSYVDAHYICKIQRLMMLTPMQWYNKTAQPVTGSENPELWNGTAICREKESWQVQLSENHIKIMNIHENPSFFQVSIVPNVIVHFVHEHWTLPHAKRI